MSEPTPRQASTDKTEHTSDLVVPVQAGPEPAPPQAPVAAPSPAPGPPRRARPVARYVYAFGRIEPRFPSLGVEKEFAQATGRASTPGLTDRESVHAVLANPANRYLVRTLCWALTIESQDTYLLIPKDGTDLDMLVNAIRPAPTGQDVDIVIGAAAGLAPADMCNGLIAPLLAFNQIYSFDTASFIVDVTEQFPFLVSPLAPSYDR